MSKPKRNGKVEVLRFIFAILIVFFHAQKHYLYVDESRLNLAFCKRGYIGVEFFFLIAGFFMAKSIYKRTHDAQGNWIFLNEETYDLGVETIQYTWRKVKAIFPWHIVSFAIMFMVCMYTQEEGYSLRKFCLRLYECIPNIFLFSKMGFNWGNLNRVEWYICCMIFAIMILYLICRRYYSMFVHVIAPVGGLFLLGYIIENYGTVTGSSNWNGFVYICMLRAIAEIALGTVTFEIARVISQRDYSKYQRMGLTFLEAGSFIFVLLFIMSTMEKKYEIYAIFAIMILISVILSEQVYGNDLFDNKISYFLGKASLPIYLSQVLPLDIVGKYMIEYSAKEKIIMMTLLTLLNAIVCTLLVKIFEGLWKKRNNIHDKL